MLHVIVLAPNLYLLTIKVKLARAILMNKTTIDLNNLMALIRYIDD